MSGIFGGGKRKQQQVQTVYRDRPDPRDEEARIEAERVRRDSSSRGRAATVLTQFLKRSQSTDAPRRTVIGGA